MGETTRLFQITEADLAELEYTLPLLADAMMMHLTPNMKRKWLVVQKILTSVRWNYGPPISVQEVSGDGN